jgi:hypothetical protein
LQAWKTLGAALVFAVANAAHITDEGTVDTVGEPQGKTQRQLFNQPNLNQQLLQGNLVDGQLLQANQLLSLQAQLLNQQRTMAGLLNNQPGFPAQQATLQGLIL